MKHPAIFFDRDDTIIRNIPYLGDPSKVEILPTVADSLPQLRAAGFLLFIVSNQSGVGRGLITREQVDAVNAEMDRQLGGAFFTQIYNCYAAPEDPYCDDRKPSPLMVLRAQEEHQLDLVKSFFVGDRLTDIQCGRNAGCRTVLVLTGTFDSVEKLAQAKEQAHFVAKDFAEATAWICKNQK